jgi:hypothetical protein
MPEMGFRPVNKYLPPRPRRDGGVGQATATNTVTGVAAAASGSLAERFFAWADQTLSR